MDASGLANNVRQMWDNEPGIMVLLCLGFIGFIVLVVDTWRHRRRRKRPR